MPDDYPNSREVHLDAIVQSSQEMQAIARRLAFLTQTSIDLLALYAKQTSQVSANPE